MTSTSRYYQVTERQLDACLRLIDDSGHVFYQVLSASEPGKTYRVTYNRTHHCLSCTCPAMNPPTDEEGYFLYAPRTCWHMRAAVAHNRQYRELKRAEAGAQSRQTHLESMGLTAEEATEALSHTFIVDGQPADDETLARVFGPRNPRPSDAELDAMANACQPRPFSVLR